MTVTAPFLRRKIMQPAPWPEALARPRLADTWRLAAQQGQHVVLLAASGYGKSTLLAEWLTDSVCAWITLDAEDADLDVCLGYMITALESALPGFVTEARGLLGRAREREAAFAALGTLLADLEEQVETPCWIVFDDYQLAASPSLDELVGRMFKYLPPHVRLAIATRRLPTLPLAGLQAKRQVRVLGEDELAFDAEELGRLRPALEPSALATLRAETGGWPAAMGLTAAQIEAYLDEEVLAGQPAEIRAFLGKAALVERFDAEVCARVLADPLDTARREWLVGRRLILPLPDGGWQIPQPLRGLLRQRTLHESPRAEREALLRRVGQAFVDEDQAASAISFWSDAGETGWAAELLTHEAEAWLDAGRLDALANQLAALGAIARTPALIAAAGELARRRGDFEHAEACFEEAQASFAARGDRPGEVRTQVRQALVAASRGQLARARACLDGAAAGLVPGSRLAIDASNVEGGLALLAGSLTAASAHFETSLTAARQLGDGFAEARAIHNIGICHTRLGEFARALACYDEALATPRADGTPAVWLTPVNRALVLIYLDRAAEARAAAEAVLALVRRYRLTREEGYALRALGLANQRLGEPGQAAACYENAERLARGADDQLGQGYSLAFQADLALDQGDWERAHALANRARDHLGGSEAADGVPEFALLRARLAVASGADADAVVTALRTRARAGGNRQLDADLQALERVSPQTPPLPAPLTGASAELRIWCFGGLRVVRGTREVAEREWQSVRAKLLMAFLLHLPEGATKGRLCEAIYPGETPSDATVGMTLMRLRKALEPGLERGQPSRYLLRADGRYRFNAEAAITLDTREFDQALAAAGHGAPAVRAAWLTQALALYVGDFLPECEDPWAVALRETYRDRALGACRRLLALAADTASAQEVLHRALAIDPLSEEFNRELLLRYLEAGEPHRARAHFAVCVRRFQDALGLPPPADFLALVAEA